nr:hypothetical protein [Tanacetum cinerariifolium]
DSLENKNNEGELQASILGPLGSSHVNTTQRDFSIVHLTPYKCVLSPFIFLTFRTFPIGLPTSSRSLPADAAITPKFDMHTFTSNMTIDEVNSIAEQYAIPLDLHLCVPSSTMTMNNLSNDDIDIYEQYLEMFSIRAPFSTLLLRIIKHFHVHISQLVSLGLNCSTMFEIYCRSLGIDLTVNLFRAFYKLKTDRFLLTDLRAIPNAMPWRYHGSCLTDPPSTGVRANDIRRLIENVVDLRPVYVGMLYEVGLTIIWKHVGHHHAFNIAEGNVAASMSEFLKLPMSGGVRIGRGTTLLQNEAIDRSGGKRLSTKGLQCCIKKKKTTPLSMALSDSKEGGSQLSGSDIIHLVSPLTTLAPNTKNAKAGGNHHAPRSDEHVKEETANTSQHDDNEFNFPYSGPSLHSKDHLEIPSLGGGAHLSGEDAHIETHATNSGGIVV